MRGDISPNGRVAKIRLRVGVPGVPAGATVDVTDLMFQPGRIQSGWQPHVMEIPWAAGVSEDGGMYPSTNLMRLQEDVSQLQEGGGSGTDLEARELAGRAQRAAEQALAAAAEQVVRIERVEELVGSGGDQVTWLEQQRDLAVTFDSQVSRPFRRTYRISLDLHLDGFVADGTDLGFIVESSRGGAVTEAQIGPYIDTGVESNRFRFNLDFPVRAGERVRLVFSEDLINPTRGRAGYSGLTLTTPYEMST